MVLTARDGSPLLMAAGLWDEWKNRETGERLKSCTMIVTEPDDFAAEIRDRMPVFLMEEHFAPWLSAGAGAGYLKYAPNDYLQRRPVSKRVNSSKAVADATPQIDDRGDEAHLRNWRFVGTRPWKHVADLIGAGNRPARSWRSSRDGVRSFVTPIDATKFK